MTFSESSYNNCRFLRNRWQLKISLLQCCGVLLIQNIYAICNDWISREIMIVQIIKSMIANRNFFNTFEGRLPVKKIRLMLTKRIDIWILFSEQFFWIPHSQWDIQQQFIFLVFSCPKTCFKGPPDIMVTGRARLADHVWSI